MKQITNPDPSQLDQRHRSYLETLLAVDEAVGEISRTLDQLGLTDNTIVFFLSDNGLHAGEQWWQSKFTSYEESIRIPFLMRYPRRYPIAQQRSEMVQNIDVAPTIVAATGVAASAMNGQSLFDFLDGVVPVREDVLHEGFTSFIVPPNKALRTPEWKYIYNNASSGIIEELYDLIADPYELVNRAADPTLQGLKQDLAAQLAARLAE